MNHHGVIIQVNGDGTNFIIQHNDTNSMESGIECHYSNAINGLYPCIGYHRIYDYWDESKQEFLSTNLIATSKLYTMSINPISPYSVLLMDNTWNIYNFNTNNSSYNLFGNNNQ